MKNAIGWIRTNVVITSSLAIMILGLLSFFWPITAQGNAFVAQMESERGREPQKIDALKQTPVEIPKTLGDPPETEMMAVSLAVVDRLKQVYEQRESQFGKLYREAQQINLSGHKVMLDGLFPKEQSEAKLYNAKERYRESLAQLYKALNAGSPLDEKALAELSAKQENKFRTENLVEDKLNDEQELKLNEMIAKAQLIAFQQHAESISIYADPATSFQSDAWVSATERPSLFDVWEGQMRLWIQQDLTAALANANTGDDPGIPAKPVKRLIEMGVASDYIGLDSNKRTPGAPPAEADLSAPIADEFQDNPTGRQSNPFYDVRLAKLSVVIDSRAIPRLLASIAKFNLMTVVGLRVTDVDEYEHLASGYWYGRVDTVQLDLMIETLWLRSWTAGHSTPEEAARVGQPFNPGIMPDSVRHYLGIKPRSEGFRPGEKKPTIRVSGQKLTRFGSQNRR